jgi:hypothetical protein
MVDSGGWLEVRRVGRLGGLDGRGWLEGGMIGGGIVGGLDGR